MRTFAPLIGVSILVCGVAAADWPEVRGPARDGSSTETSLPNSWSPVGENLLWRAPFGSASAPVVLGDRVYLQNMVGDGASLQERLLCLDANTGNLVWEKRLAINHSDTLPRNAGLATPALDPATGAVYAFSAAGTLLAYTRAGVSLWIRDLTEEFGYVPPESGQVASPLVEGTLVIMSGITFGWGEHGSGGQRFFAFDKQTGDSVWISAPEKRMYAASASPLLVMDVDETRTLVAGGSDGVWHALEALTGKPIWRYDAITRALHAGAITAGRNLILVQGDGKSDPDGPALPVAFPLNLRGEITSRKATWLANDSVAATISSPVSDGRYVYVINKSGGLTALDASTGKRAWSQESLKISVPDGASPTLADGKLFIGTADDKILIVRLRPDGAEIASETAVGSAERPERVAHSVAISQGRVYIATSQALYAIGARTARIPVWAPPGPPPQAVAEHRPTESIQTVQIIPGDAALEPGQAVHFRVKLFDAKGRLVREEGPPLPGQSSLPGRGQITAGQAAKSDLQWAIEGPSGVVEPGGGYRVPDDARAQAGRVTVRVGAAVGESRVRVLPRVWDATFEDSPAGSVPLWWIGARDRFVVKRVDTGNVLATVASGTRHARTFAGLHRSTNYTIEGDIRFGDGTMLSEGGLLAQGYELVLSGSRQQLDLRSWQAESARTKSIPAPIKAAAWYRLKLRAELQADGGARVSGKVWKVAESEPATWAVERRDPPGAGQLIGSPGVTADGPSEVDFDNLRVTSN